MEEVRHAASPSVLLANFLRSSGLSSFLWMR